VLNTNRLVKALRADPQTVVQSDACVQPGVERPTGDTQQCARRASPGMMACCRRQADQCRRRADEQEGR